MIGSILDERKGRHIANAYLPTPNGGWGWKIDDPKKS